MSQTENRSSTQPWKPRNPRDLLTERAGLRLRPAPVSPGIVVSMRGGHPDPAHFPIRDLLASAERALRRNSLALQYGDVLGFPDLRDFIVARVKRDDAKIVAREQVMVSSGGLHALGLLFEALLDPGDLLVVEAPTYGAVLSWIGSRKLKAIAIPVDENGMRVDELETRLGELWREGRLPKLVYTIPTFHNPTGTEMSLERRRRLVQLAAQWGFLIIEDETYRDLRFEGAALPSLYSLDEAGLVVKIGSFSKTVAPGLRLGLVVGHPDIVSALGLLRTDLGSSPWLAATVADYVSGGRFEERVQYLCSFYRDKRDRMLAALEAHCTPFATWRIPRGGFFFWLRTAPGIEANQLLEESRKEGLEYNPGFNYFLDGSGGDRLRLVFANVTLDKIDPGIAALGRALARCANG